MKYILYDILLHLSIAALLPYFLFKMLTTRKYREGIPERFGFIKKSKLAGAKGRTLWVHAVSVGETRAVLPAVKLLKKRNPALRVVFSTVTRTGQETARKDGAGLIDSLVYFPLDLSWAVGLAVRAIDPAAFVVVEKEVWPNCFREMGKRGVPIIVVNGTISERSYGRFKKLGFFFREVFALVSSFCARTEGDRRRAVGLGVPQERAVTTGNIKFDLSAPSTDGRLMDGLKKGLGITGAELVIVAGSTHAGEEEEVLSAFKELQGDFPGLKLIIAPRHPERFAEAASLIKKAGFDCARRSGGVAKNAPVVLLDTVGELMMVYSFATVAIVGGSIAPGIGGHNLLEPAYWGKPVVYGGNLTTYMEMAEMLEAAGGGVRVGRGEMHGALYKLLGDSAMREDMGGRARALVEANRGAAEKSVAVIEGHLNLCRD